MVRTYRRKTQRAAYGTEKLVKALESLSEGRTVSSVSREYGVPRRTLKRHRNAKVVQPLAVKMGRYDTVFPPSLEQELKEHILVMESCLYGLTTKDVRKLAFDLAERTKIKHPFTDGMAGVDWLRGFMNRNKDISLRKPEGTSLNRAVAFNRQNVSEFFRVYTEVLRGGKYTARQIWNTDETGITPVQVPGKVLTTKGKRCVGKITSAERGELVTVVAAINAAGQYLPPMFIWPRKRNVDALMAGTPPGSIGCSSSSGWIDSDLFLQWLRHFRDWTHSSLENLQVLLLDGHHSHKTLAAVEFAREHGITMITLPPHTSHKSQPLERSVFKAQIII